MTLTSDQDAIIATLDRVFWDVAAGVFDIHNSMPTAKLWGNRVIVAPDGARTRGGSSVFDFDDQSLVLTTRDAALITNTLLSGVDSVQRGSLKQVMATLFNEASRAIGPENGQVFEGQSNYLNTQQHGKILRSGTAELATLLYLDAFTDALMDAIADAHPSLSETTTRFARAVQHAPHTPRYAPFVAAMESIFELMADEFRTTPREEMLWFMERGRSIGAIEALIVRSQRLVEPTPREIAAIVSRFTAPLINLRRDFDGFRGDNDLPWTREYGRYAGDAAFEGLFHGMAVALWQRTQAHAPIMQ